MVRIRRWPLVQAAVSCLIATCVIVWLGTGCGRSRTPSEDPDKQHEAEPASPTPTEDSTPTSLPEPRTPQWHFGTICLDAGHGGRDSGTEADGTCEKELTLAITQAVREGLSAHGAPVIMTRNNDSFVSLGRRARICNDARAGLFVSIHVNGFHEPGPHGFELYYFNGATRSEAGRVAEEIRAALHEALPEARDRGVRQADFSVLAGTHCPAILIEVGYLTNPNERQRLLDPEYRQRVADAIVDGIITFVLETESNNPEMAR